MHQSLEKWFTIEIFVQKKKKKVELCDGNMVFLSYLFMNRKIVE